MDRVQDEVQRVMQALGSPVRREILWLVAEDERPAGEIAAAVAVSAPTVSEHLKVLRQAGLVTMRGGRAVPPHPPPPRGPHGPPRPLPPPGGPGAPARGPPPRGPAR